MYYLKVLSNDLLLFLFYLNETEAMLLRQGLTNKIIIIFMLIGAFFSAKLTIYLTELLTFIILNNVSSIDQSSLC